MSANPLQIQLQNKVKDLEFKLNHDSLTGLKNRYALYDDLQNNEFKALFMIDIDDFQSYNELYGIDAGNKILKDFATYLNKYNKHNRYDIYKLYGDCFILRAKDENFSEETCNEDIVNLLEKLKTFSVYLEEIDEHIEIGVTFGITFNGKNPLAKANTALKYAKKKQKHFMIYNESIDVTKQSKESIFWRGAIKHAIHYDNIIPVFQPIVNRDKKIIKYEVLMRLVKEESGKIKLVSPFFFLDIAMKTKQYEELTKIMVKKSFAIMKKLGSDFSINLSFEDIKNTSVINMLEEETRKHSLGSQLILEITESESVEDYKIVQNFVEKFRKLNVKIAIDDFGSGFSNFTHILEISPDYLKLDGSLIKNIDTDKKSYELVKAISYLTKALNIKTIAEFIHSEEVFQITHDLGIDEFQGFYFSEPLKEEDLLKTE